MPKEKKFKFNGTDYKFVEGLKLYRKRVISRFETPQGKTFKWILIPGPIFAKSNVRKYMVTKKYIKP